MVGSAALPVNAIMRVFLYCVGSVVVLVSAASCARATEKSVRPRSILAGPLMELAESFSSAVRPGGRTLLSGLLLEQADDLLAVYRRWGFAPERHLDLETGGALWRPLLLRRT